MNVFARSLIRVMAFSSLIATPLMAQSIVYDSLPNPSFGRYGGGPYAQQVYLSGTQRAVTRFDLGVRVTGDYIKEPSEFLVSLRGPNPSGGPAQLFGKAQRSNSLLIPAK
jgi:hypothetical protein